MSDLVIDIKDDRTIAELKYDTGTPMLALIELLKNAKLCVNAGQTLASIAIIAPRFYYADFWKKTSVSSFLSIINAFNRFSIRIYQINIDEHWLQRAIDAYLQKNQDLDWKKSKRIKYDRIATVNASHVIRCMHDGPSGRAALVWPFQQICNLEDWLQS
jgi:hypothetical protein